MDKFLSHYLWFLPIAAVCWYVKVFYVPSVSEFCKARQKIIEIVIYYANAFNSANENYKNRKEVFRKASSELTATLNSLNLFYRGWLLLSGYDVEKACTLLMLLSNISDEVEAGNITENLKKALRIDTYTI